MAAYFKYGSWSAPAGTADVKISKSAKFNDAQEPIATIERWAVDIWILLAYGSLTGQLSRLEAAFAQSGGNLSFFHHELRTTSCVGGTRVVVPPSYPVGTGVELVTKRMVHVEVEGEMPRDASGRVTLSFTESVEADAEPTVGYLSTLTGTPVAQRLRRIPLRTYRQRGRAVGYGDYPTVPAPLWPGNMIKDPVISYDSPERIGRDNYVSWPVTWEYTFQSGRELTGRPHKWRGR